MGIRTEIPPGTLYMLILKTLARLGPRHGYGIAEHIQQISEDVLTVEEGSLYPALHRMERQKLLRASWREAEGRRRKYYELTDAGRAELAARKRSWQSFAAGVSAVLGIGRATRSGLPSLD